MLLAKRQSPEDGERRDPLTLINKGEYRLLATELIDVNRPDEDEDPHAARRAAQDMDELTLGRPDRRSSSRVRMELDVAAGASAAPRPRPRLRHPRSRRAPRPDGRRRRAPRPTRGRAGTGGSRAGR